MPHGGVLVIDDSGTVRTAAIAAIGVRLYTFDSSSVQDSFNTIVSFGLLFALYYSLTGIATAMYLRSSR